MTLTEPAPAKLNLALHVRARRPDGYHELETLFAFCADGDVLMAAPADRTSLAITGPCAAGLAADDSNLVVAAYRLFEEQVAPLPKLAMTLDKRLPVASGIGGGSADAAAALRVFARIADVGAEDTRVMAVATRLGSDVPACLSGVTALGRGRGEQLEPVPGLAGTPVLLVNPGVAVSTAAVFAGWDGVDRGPLPAGDAMTIARTGRNDLQAAALELAPAVADVVAALAPDALVARMSGSGATCFALYADCAGRNAAAARIAAARPEWWTLATALA